MKGKLTDRSQDNITAINEGCQSLVAFSNHLMLILVAVIAFSSAAAFKNDQPWSELLFSLGILLSLLSFYLGYSANIERINSFLKIGHDYTLAPPEDRITLGVLEKIKKTVYWQYVASMLAIFCIAGSIWHTIFQDEADSRDTFSCTLKEENKLVCEFIFQPTSTSKQDKTTR